VAPRGESDALRKARGAFFTPEPIADHLAAWAVNGNSGARVLDPTCGEAVFLLAAARRLRASGCPPSYYALETIRTQVTEGTSALFVVTEEGDLDRLGERFHGMHSKLIATNLTEAERSVLHETFGGA
jgi:hypothetical protein